MIRELQDIYDKVPPANCDGRCFQCCSWIGTFPVEKRNMRASGITPPDMREAPCRHLDFAGRCSIYEERPIICRLYGVSEDLVCPFCTPDVELSKTEAFDLMRLVEGLRG